MNKEKGKCAAANQKQPTLRNVYRLSPTRHRNDVIAQNTMHYGVLLNYIPSSMLASVFLSCSKSVKPVTWEHYAQLLTWSSQELVMGSSKRSTCPLKE